MKYYIGLDVGTSGLKGLLVDGNGKILKEANAAYPISYPHEGWSEQNPNDWFVAAQTVLKELACAEVCAISFGGQMHGLVALDSNNQVIRPAILWNDGRTQKQTDYLNEVVGKNNLSAYTGNIAFAGFTAPKILWMKENEPHNFARIAKIMLPKDYLSFMLSGAFATDYSDASGMLLLDVKNKRWSQEMCKVCSVKEEWLPKLCESYEVVGRIKPQLAKELGLPQTVKIVAGAGDNAAAAVGTGTVGKGACNISLGTSGTIFLSDDSFSVDSQNALHSFCHADGKWHLMGCILSAASCRKWWLEDILGSYDYNADEREATEAADSGLIYLPYLMGERSPHNDVNAKGAFIGMTATTTKGQMSKAVMEGVAFALRDCLEVAKTNGVYPTYTNLCGGGAKSKLWRQIIADVFNLPVHIPETEQGPAYGGAILAMVGSGAYQSVQEATAQIVRTQEVIQPNPQQVAFYNKKYNFFKKLYPTLKDIFRETL